MRTLTGTKRIATWATAGVFGAGALTGVVLSQTGLASADSTTPNPTSTEQPSPAGQAGPRHPGPLQRALYGDVTVKDKDSTSSHVVHFIRGKASVDGDTLTVTSADNHVETYTVDSTTTVVVDGQKATIADLAGKQVRVVAPSPYQANEVATRVESGRPPHPLRDFVRDHVATGTVTSINGSSVTIKTKNGDQTYAITDKTRFAKDGQKATVDDINVGDTVHVPWAKDSNGTQTALGVVEGKLPRPPMGPRPGDANQPPPQSPTENG